MKLREEEFYEQYHQHGGTTIIPTEIFNELYDDATEEIERLNNIINKAIEYITRNCYKVLDKQLYGIPIMSIKLDNADNLLDILKGVDKE